MEFIFEQTPWDATLASLKSGDRMSAVRCLTLLETMSQEEAEEALCVLEEKAICLDLSDLPSDTGGEAAPRLQLEKRLAQSGQLMQNLEENDPLRVYLEELAAVPAAGDAEQLAVRYAQGDTVVAQELVNLFLGTVVESACRLTGRGVLLMDLIQEGSLGLLQGILSYTGGNFTEHIRWWIDHYLCKAVILQAHSRGVGQKLREGMQDFRDTDQRLLAELGRNPTLEEIAAAMHITPEEATTLDAILQQARLRQQVDQMKAPRETTPEDGQAVENTAYFQLRQRIAGMLSSLTEQEATLLTLRYGLDNNPPQSPEQVGAAMGITPDAVLRLEAAALQKLRQQENKEETV